MCCVSYESCREYNMQSMSTTCVFTRRVGNLLNTFAGQVDEVRLCIRQYKLAAIVGYVKANTSKMHPKTAGINVQMLYKDLFDQVSRVAFKLCMHASADFLY